MEMGTLLDVCLFLCSLHHFFGPRPDTNGVAMGLYHLPLEVEFAHEAGSAERLPLSCTDRSWDLQVHNIVH